MSSRRHLEEGGITFGMTIRRLIFKYMSSSSFSGSGLTDHGHRPDEQKIHSLEKKVFKLENEVTVLETAMADLAKRLLVVEQKSGMI